RRSGVTINYQPHLNAAPLHPHRDESGEGKFVRSRGITPIIGWDRQFDRNLDPVLLESDAFDQPGQYWSSFRFGPQAFNPSLGGLENRRQSAGVDAELLNPPGDRRSIAENLSQRRANRPLN